jgi:hypothetical protein
MINFLRLFKKFDANIRKGTKFIFSERYDPNHRNVSELYSMMYFFDKTDMIVFQTNYIIIQKEFFIIEFIKQRSYYFNKKFILSNKL